MEICMLTILVDDEYHLYLTDFGAAWDYSTLDVPIKKGIQALEVCAFGWLVGELLSFTNSPKDEELDKLFQSCTFSDPNCRPNFSEILQILSK